MSGASFQVRGIAQPQGSTRSFRHPKTGAVITTSDNPKVQPWRQAIAAEAFRAGCTPAGYAVFVNVDVYLPRPKRHFGKRGLLPSAPKHPIVKPDADKLLRAILDALTGVAYRDDAQVASIRLAKHYDDEGLGPQTLISVGSIQETP